MNSGASTAPAVIGSMTSDSSGMPMIANPPPKAPCMKAIRNMPRAATRIDSGSGMGRRVKGRRTIPAVAPETNHLMQHTMLPWRRSFGMVPRKSAHRRG